MRSPAGGSAIRRRWLDGLARLAPLHGRVLVGGFPAPLPALATVEAAAGRLPRGKGSIFVLGQPGAVGACTAWIDACGGTGVEVFTSAAGTEVPARGWVALLGPPWIDAAIEGAVARGVKVAVATGRVGGEAIEPPPRGSWIDDAHAGDARLGALGTASLVVAQAAGLDVGAALAGAAEVLTQANGPPGIDNPAWSLARALRILDSDLGRDSVVHVAGEGRLVALAAWAARVQVGTLGALRRDGSGRALPGAVEAGDEEWLEALVHGPRSRVLVVWERENSPLEAVSRPWVACAAEAGQVVLRVRLAGLEPGAVGAAMALWVRACACLALLEESEAVPLSAVGRLYDAMERTMLPVADEGGVD